MEQIRQQIRVGGEKGAFTAGVSKVEITPPVGTPLAGYAKRRGKPSVGIRDPLYVRVLALSDGEDTAVILSTDLLVFPMPLAEKVIDRLEKEFGLPRQGIVLAATHTHSGAGAIARGFIFEQVFGPYRDEVVEGITSRILWAVRQALKGRKPVRWAAAAAPVFLGGWVENRAMEGGAVDSSLSVLFLETLEGKPLVVVVSAAAHPTLLDSRDMRMSADFPGEVTRRMESEYPGIVSLFLNGGAGDARPKDSIGSNSQERIERFGTLLAEGAVGLVNQAKLKQSGDVAVWGGWMPLPPSQMRLGPIPIHPEIGRLIRPDSAFMHLVALDEVLLIPLPAEVTTALAVGLKQQILQRELTPLVIGYTGGYLGYAVTAEEYRSGSYEASMTWYGPEFGQRLVNRVALLARLYSDRVTKQREKTPSPDSP